MTGVQHAGAGATMAGFEQVDFYTDRSLVEDPFPYFEYLRSQGPVCRLPRRNVIAITGFDEALTVLNDTKSFASVNFTNGPISDLPFPVESDDISART